MTLLRLHTNMKANASSSTSPPLSLSGSDNELSPETPATPISTPPKYGSPRLEPAFQGSPNARNRSISWPLQRPFPEPLHVSPEVYGRGGFSTIYKAVSVNTKQLYALKVRRASSSTSALENECRMLDILATPGCEGVVRFFGTYEHTGLVLEFFQYDLEHYVKNVISTKDTPPNTKRWKSWALKLAEAVEYIHSKDIIHGDIKPSNVLINIEENRDHLAIADFSSAKTVLSTTNSLVGSPLYSAPELLSGSKPTMKSDVYALGLTLLFCATRKDPYSLAKNPYQRIMWQRAMPAIQSYEPESLRGITAVREYIDMLLELRDLPKLIKSLEGQRQAGDS